MPEVVLAVGLLVTALSLFLIVRPGSVAGLLDAVFDSRWLYAAALVRLLLGAALIASAPPLKYAAAVGLIGWLFVLGGLLLMVIPAPAMLRMTGWFAGLSSTMTRLWLLFALGFGLFLVYAALA